MLSKIKQWLRGEDEMGHVEDKEFKEPQKMSLEDMYKKMEESRLFSEKCWLSEEWANSIDLMARIIRSLRQANTKEADDLLHAILEYSTVAHPTAVIKDITCALKSFLSARRQSQSHPSQDSQSENLETEQAATD